MKKIKLEVVKFILVGSINFVLTFAIYFGLVRLTGVNYLLSLAVASTIGVLFTYTLNYVWVFKPEKRLIFKSRLVKYFASSCTAIILNLILLRITVEYTKYDPLYVQIVLIPIIVTFNFTTAKFWSLKESINSETRIENQIGRE